MVISSHSQKPVFSINRQRSCGEAIRAQRVFVPPAPSAAATLSGQGLSCWWWWGGVGQNDCSVEASCSISRFREAVCVGCFYFVRVTLIHSVKMVLKHQRQTKQQFHCITTSEKEDTSWRRKHNWKPWRVEQKPTWQTLKRSKMKAKVRPQQKTYARMSKTDKCLFKKWHIHDVIEFHILVWKWDYIIVWLPVRTPH